MPDEPAQSEIRTLTRRFKQAQERTDREFGIVKSDLTALRLQVDNLDQKVSNLGSKVDELADEMRGLSEKVDRNQAQIVQLLSALVGKSPDAS
ncbi:hypothetical protein [Streptomyces netropsis]|uniref:Peptidoglycan hydrolase CwlO-like protein n=1 Tax=Streptomyces netropsis TaxID=55404 RepID=A0A7W7PGW1_STRNE|nr:hypothetical protein [Streptomyces netropsis]MBB4890406.1 peptidoglycan hydrolase CwlO-like protein [Streptomyces netropsis]GGR46172.1 hypothetical protein GCM10010219_59730 [Streptomyces netropsis]